jgi:hypothetical protein
MGEAIHEREHRKERRELNARVALFRKIVNTYGFASLAAAVGSSALDGKAFGDLQTAGVVVGLAFHALALYLAPIGAEKSDE